MRVATLAPEHSPYATVLRRFETAVESGSRGLLEVDIAFSGALGSETATVASAAAGQLEAVAASAGALASRVPALDALELPFLLSTFVEVDVVLTAITPAAEMEFRKGDLVLGFWRENGFRHLGTTFPITGPDDLRGRRMRAQPSAVHAEMWRQLAAEAIAMEAAAVPGALARGEIVGFDQSLLYASAAGWTRHISHLLLTGHIYQPGALAFSRAWFDALPQDLQQLVISEGRRLTDEGRHLVRAETQRALDELATRGIEVRELTVEQRAAFSSRTAGVKEKLKRRDAATAALIELIDVELARLR
jgi:TRAP-type C4-dicarboxylate transport system substrate-binding protein